MVCVKKNAVAIESTMVAVSALSGFTGHAVAGHFDYRIAITLAIGGAIGELIHRTDTLEQIFFLINILPAVFQQDWEAYGPL
jgi:uncharacterized membrane protein YfcA